MAPTSRRQVFTGTFVHSRTRTELEYLHDTAICVDEQGAIVKIQRGVGSGPDATAKLLSELQWPEADVDIVTAKEGQFFFPGFIDTHVHASQYPNVGLFGKSTLLDWLDKYTFPVESSLSDLSRARRVYSACVKRTLRHGTTTAAYYATIDVAATNLLADLCLSLGQRALVGRVCMDSEGLCPSYYRDENALQSIERTKETIAHMRKIDPKGTLVGPILTPRFAPACTSEAMLELSRMQKELDLPVQTHISENKGEVALVKELFPQSKSYADVYEQHGLLTDRTILAHAVHLTDEEAELVKSRGSKISHCPCSNSSLTSGAARVRWMWAKGIDVGLGTDMSGGYSSSILENARQAALVSRHVTIGEDEKKEGKTTGSEVNGHTNGSNGTNGVVKESSTLTVEEVLYLSTRGGAVVVGMQDKIGGFEEGMQWDAQLVGMSGDEDDEAGGESWGEGNVDIFGWEDWEERMAKWLYGGDDRNTKKVWVKGRLVHARKGE